MLRHQHEHFAKLVRDAEEERNNAVRDGQRARQELDDKTRELQRVYESADNFVQQKDQAIGQALSEAAEWRRQAQERDGIVQLLENRAVDMQAHIRNLENHADAQHDARMAVSEETMDRERQQLRHELQTVRTQCGEAQIRVDLLLKAESMMERQNFQLREEIRSGSFPASEAAFESADRLLRSQREVKDLERQNRELRQDRSASRERLNLCRRRLGTQWNSV